MSPHLLIGALVEARVSLAVGVPDSLLKPLCNQLNEACAPLRHLIAASEGGAIGLAIGHHLATGELAAVYLQNSGLGNAINPLVSLADPAVYGVPLVLIVGWRAELAADGTQTHDEPQHRQQGRITLALLDTLSIPYLVLDGAHDDPAAIRRLLEDARQQSRPVALVVRKDAFDPAPPRARAPHQAIDPRMTREQAIALIVDEIGADAAIVATTGMASRELYELRERLGQSHARDFLTVGGMGHASQIATGIALARPDQPVVCIDGDGALLMHMGGLAYCAGAPNLTHVVINNGVHDSVGAQPTLAARLRLAHIAGACGYAFSRTAATPAELAAALRHANDAHESAFIEALCRPGYRSDLGRPRTAPVENKQHFMQFLSSQGVHDDRHPHPQDDRIQAAVQCTR
ncbi:phosphonopyruvate decarboxylase [Burkholderia sp. FERM BP-3421]|jgi:phosphonopyruvate decarboxylase|uniref:phosphonopyruvate decarboxylase n=1 Tax=Burkholderia sp. FERM BP-3421 TaxID=1494466 RepID=UPI00235F2FF1|nr:phosphonopyruvate decarboxylase [Burkholderia sp. FERM BP-3421]WDD95586.1 phosphonopyruvate decarboxylase [Burkholderia sp. FERM BP-3421]